MKRRILEWLVREHETGLSLAALVEKIDAMEVGIALALDDLYRGGFVVQREGYPLVWHITESGLHELDRLIAEPIDCTHTQEITCPYCGNAFRDSWDVNLELDSDEEVECHLCERTFTVIKTVTVSYSSFKKDGQP